MPEEPAVKSADAADAATGAGAAAAGGDPLLARVPAHLIERSVAAKARWFDKRAGG
jgi:hypothetical protein